MNIRTSTVSDQGKNRKQQTVAENRLAMLAITFVVCILFVVLMVKGFQLRSTIQENYDANDALRKEITEEKDRTEDIRDLADYMQTDEYIEQAAKERLGLVEDDEIIFKSEK